MQNKNEWANITDKELARAIELMVEPGDLMERRVMIAVLEACDHRPEDVKSQLESGEQLHDGAMLSWNFGITEPEKP